VRRYFDQGLMLTLNTDDPAMFRTSLSREYAIAQKTFGFTEEQLRELARNSFEASFLDAERKVKCWIYSTRRRRRFGNAWHSTSAS